MANTYEIIFRQDASTVPYGGMSRAAENWIRLNRDKVKVVAGSYRKVLLETEDGIYIDAIYLKYEADAELPGPTSCDHSTTTVETTDATCSKEGLKVTYCSKCGIELSREVIPMMDHTPVEKKISDPTCHKEGRIDTVCSVCNKILSSKSIPMIPHTEVEEVIIQGDCSKPGMVIKKCSVCGDYLGKESTESTDHTWVSNNDGTHTCSKCGKTETCHPNAYCDTCEICGYVTPDDVVLNITTSSINTMTLGKVFSQKLNATATTGVDWSITSGKLPSGVKLSGDTISGTPTDYGSFSVTIQAKYHKQIVNKTYSITVNDPVTLQITSMSVNNGKVGQVYSNSVIKANVSNSECTWRLASGNLPAGLKFDSASATISGTPTQSGTFTFTIECKYHAQTVTKQFSMKIEEISVTITFNATNGMVIEKTRVLTKGSKIGTLPVPTADSSLTFLGWYTAETGGTKVDTNYTVSSNVTLYAHWEAVVVPEPEHEPEPEVPETEPKVPESETETETEIESESEVSEAESETTKPTV